MQRLGMQLLCLKVAGDRFERCCFVCMPVPPARRRQLAVGAWIFAIGREDATEFLQLCLDAHG